MADFILGLIDSWSYFAVFGLMLAENIFPPIPSEAVLPLTGVAVSQGQLTFLGASLAAIIGSTLGTTLWFLLGWQLSTDRLKNFLEKYGVYFAISVQDFEFTERIFRKYSTPSIFFCRLIPTIRSVISLPAGSIHMNFKLFLGLTLAGTAIWNTLLISAGMGFSQFIHILEEYLNPVVNSLIIFFLFIYLLQIIRFWYIRKKSKTNKL